MTPTTADHPTAASDRTRRSNVKTRLTPNRRHRSVENDEYASFTRRVIRAYARRIATGDVDALADMTGLATEMDEAISQAVIGLRKTGYSWAEIAARLGVTRQAAQQRWGRRQ
jgi:ribosomal protein S20